MSLRAYHDDTVVHEFISRALSPHLTFSAENVFFFGLCEQVDGVRYSQSQQQYVVIYVFIYFVHVSLRLPASLSSTIL